MRLRLGRGLRRGVLLASEDRVPAKREAVHAEAKQSLQPDTGLNPSRSTNDYFWLLHLGYRFDYQSPLGV